mmetsp:Transcript_68301/g.165187  ORF Transcript_68301/g.165187 Transcript_68301/m.165187 type:complete len:281 (-) Transcript_68301:588-1430(-)
MRAQIWEPVCDSTSAVVSPPYKLGRWPERLKRRSWMSRKEVTRAITSLPPWCAWWSRRCSLPCSSWDEYQSPLSLRRHTSRSFSEPITMPTMPMVAMHQARKQRPKLSANGLSCMRVPKALMPAKPATWPRIMADAVVAISRSAAVGVSVTPFLVAAASSPFLMSVRAGSSSRRAEPVMSLSGFQKMTPAQTETVNWKTSNHTASWAIARIKSPVSGWSTASATRSRMSVLPESPDMEYFSGCSCHVTNPLDALKTRTETKMTMVWLTARHACALIWGSG